jgi:hypothetical protein
MEVLEKHKRYLEHHIPGEVFWGLGIENETYLELETGKEVPPDFLQNRKRERYSVNYWMQYKTKPLQVLLDVFQKSNTNIHLPLLVNGHTFTKCDPWGEHATNYTANPTRNPKFAGKTLLEVLAAAEPHIFGPDAKDTWWCFDGDTVEFMTQAFRCTTVTEVVKELVEAKTTWMEALRMALATVRCEAVLKGMLRWPRQNPGFAVFLSNRQNVAVFNNGTYHINLTAPSRLDKDGLIEDWPKFLHIHRQGARLFQWLSPFLVAAYGSGDILAQLGTTRLAKEVAKGFPAGSQRLAASRYVSVGTYDTRRMPTGKLLTSPIAEMEPQPLWFLDMYKGKQRTAYTMMDAIGYDINFHKFPNHGLEFRIFDWFPEGDLAELLEMLVKMMDKAMSVPYQKEVPVPQDSAIWRKVLGRCVWEGASALLSPAEQRLFAAVLGLQLVPKGHSTVLEMWATVKEAWKSVKGPCSACML